MVDISEELTAIQTDNYGEDVRNAIVSAVEKLSADANEKVSAMQDMEDAINALLHGNGGD